MATNSERTTVRRLPDRGAYDRQTIDAILDEGIVCHVGFVDGGQPYVLPTLHARVGDVVYLHASAATRLARLATRATPLCLTVTLLDALVLARSAFDHSVNYRSVVLLGTPIAITDPAEKLQALRAFTERIVPGRWNEVRPPTPQEVKGTAVLGLPIAEASAKVRVGPPSLGPEDDVAIWGGLVPILAQLGPPVPDGRSPADVPVPPSVVRVASLGRGRTR